MKALDEMTLKQLYAMRLHRPNRTFLDPQLIQGLQVILKHASGMLQYAKEANKEDYYTLCKFRAGVDKYMTTLHDEDEEAMQLFCNIVLVELISDLVISWFVQGKPAPTVTPNCVIKVEEIVTQAEAEDWSSERVHEALEKIVQQVGSGLVISTPIPKGFKFPPPQRG